MKTYLMTLIFFVLALLFVSCDGVSDLVGEMSGADESELESLKDVENSVNETFDSTLGVGAEIPDGLGVKADEIKFGVGEAIATPDTAAKLAVDGFIFPAGPSIGFEITNHPELDFEKIDDFKITLPVTDMGWSLYSMPELVVVYHIKTKEGSDDYRIGVIFKEDLIIGDGFVQVSAKGYGLYQAGFMEGVIPDKLEITTKEEPPKYSIEEYSWENSGDTTPPMALVDFTQLGPGDSISTIKVELTFPSVDDLDDYERIEIRSALGTTPPDCDSGSFGNYIGGDQLSGKAGLTEEYPVHVNEPGKSFALRACIYDHNNNLTDSNTSVNGTVKAKPQYIFVTSSKFNGNLGGLAGADAKCEAAALASSYGPIKTEQEWLAVLSTSAHNAAGAVGGRIYTNDEVFNYDASQNGGTDVRVTNLSSYLFAGSLANPIFRDEDGASPPVGTAWTGSTSAGAVTSNTCLNWIDSGSGNLGTMGTTTNTDGKWIEDATAMCSVEKTLYCISTFKILDFTASSVDMPSGEIELHMHAPDTAHFTYDSIKIVRAYGYDPKPDCSDGTTVDTLSAPFSNDCYSLTETGVTPGSNYHYRACVFNGSEVLDSDLAIVAPN